MHQTIEQFGTGLKKGKANKVKKAAVPRGKRGYDIFIGEARQMMKEKYPNSSGNEITKKLAEQWKYLTNEEQKVYNQRAVQV